MTSDDKDHDVNQPSPPAPPDLAVLTAHPSLVSLQGRGRLLDDLPTDSVTWAFIGTLVAGFGLFGRIGAGVVVTWTFLTVPVAVLLLRKGELSRARLTLDVSRYGLLSMLVGLLALATTITGPSPLGGDTAAPSSAQAAATAPAPTGSISPDPASAGTSGATPASPAWSP
jgi:hypothetical protein